MNELMGIFVRRSCKQLAAFLLILLCSTCFGFTEEKLYFETVEEQEPNTRIGTFSTNHNHTYRISGNDESKQYLDLDLNIGTIKVKRKIDREALKCDQLALALIDENNLSITALKVQVKDLNDNSPQFPSAFYNVSLLESVPLGTRVSLPAAFDPDKAENGSIVAYQLESPSSTFALAASNGNESASLYLTSQLNREENITYELVLIAFDSGKPRRQGQMTIFINVQDSNETPRFEKQDYNVTVNAKVSANQLLLKVNATDVDTGENGQIYYHIENDPSNQFLINNESGEIYVKPKIDFLHCNRSNAQNVCLITVEAVDGGNPPLKARKLVRIIVNESSTHLPTLQIKTYPLGFDSAFVYENAKSDAVIAVLTSNANLSIVSGNEGGWFRLESGNNFGIIRLVHLEPISTKQTYELIIQAQDKGVSMQTIQETLKLIVYDNVGKYRYLDESNNQTYSICKGLPCYNGKCDSDIGCQCSISYGGVYCNEKTFAFKFGSLLELKMVEDVNNFSLQFRSSSSSGLLFYTNLTNGSYLAIESLNGKLILSGQLDGQQIKMSHVLLKEVDDYATLTFELNSNNTTILVNSNGQQIRQLGNFFKDNHIFVGGIPDQLFSRQTSNQNFYGCIKNIQINKQPLNSTLIVEERLMMQTCPFDNHQNACSRPEAQLACKHGRCQSTWEGFYCICNDGFESMDCRLENQTVSNGHIRLTPSRYSRQKLVSYVNDTIVRDLDDRLLYIEHERKEHWSGGESVTLIDKWPSQWIEFDVRTKQLNSTFFTVQTANRQAQLKSINGQLYYSLAESNESLLASLHLNDSKFINDKRWHRITVEIASDNKSIRLRVDDLYVDSVMDVDFPQFLSTNVTFIEIGTPSFRGCIRRLLVNNQFHSLDSSNGSAALEKQFFQLSTINGTTSSDGCTAFTICSMENECPMEMLLQGVSVRELIILSIVLLLLFLCILIGLQIHRRFQKKQRLTNVQRIHNLQLISSSDSEYAYNNASYNSNADFAYVPSYIPIYSNISYPPSEICSCHLKFDYEDNLHKNFSSQCYLQDGVSAKFGLRDLTSSQDCSLSSSSTDIPLDPSLSNLTEREYNLRKLQ